MTIVVMPRPVCIVVHAVHRLGCITLTGAKFQTSVPGTLDARFLARTCSFRICLCGRSRPLPEGLVPGERLRATANKYVTGTIDKQVSQGCSSPPSSVCARSRQTC